MTSKLETDKLGLGKARQKNRRRQKRKYRIQNRILILWR